MVFGSVSSTTMLSTIRSSLGDSLVRRCQETPPSWLSYSQLLVVPRNRCLLSLGSAAKLRASPPSGPTGIHALGTGFAFVAACGDAASRGTEVAAANSRQARRAFIIDGTSSFNK